MCTLSLRVCARVCARGCVPSHYACVVCPPDPEAGLKKRIDRLQVKGVLDPHAYHEMIHCIHMHPEGH